MKKKLLTVFACLAVVVLAGFGLAGCGNKTAHKVSFGDATVNFVTNKNYTIKGLKWTEVKEAAEDEHFADYTGVWKLDEGQTVQKLETPVDGNEYLVCVTIAGDGADFTKLVAKTKNSEDVEFGQENGNKIADPSEKDFHLLISVSQETKTVILSLDWDGKDGEDAQLYKFIIPAGLKLSGEVEE